MVLANASCNDAAWKWPDFFEKFEKPPFPSLPSQSLCQWRQKGVSRPNWGGVAADFHDAQLENQTLDGFRIGAILLVKNSSIDCESFISGLSSPPPPFEAILVIFGRRALIFFCLKALEKNEKWHHFCAHAQWWSPWRRKNVEKGHLAPSNSTFFIICDRHKRFSQNERRRIDLQNLPQIF